MSGTDLSGDYLFININENADRGRHDSKLAIYEVKAGTNETEEIGQQDVDVAFYINANKGSELLKKE